MCFWHNWTKWETFEKGKTYGSPYDDWAAGFNYTWIQSIGSTSLPKLPSEKVIGSFERQRRYCAHCGKSELRTVRS